MLPALALLPLLALVAPRTGAAPRPMPTADADRPTPRAADDRPPLTVVGHVPEQNKAIYLGYKGHIDTDLSFADFFGSDHTVMAWYMPQYPYGNTGPIVAENGIGTYAFGQDDYRLGDGDNGDAGSPVFFVQVGNKKVNYLLPEMIPGKWIHVAVVRKGDTVSLYVWGVKRTPVTVTNKSTNATSNVAEIKVSSASNKPSGKLRFGRRTDGNDGSNMVWQTYGLIDDVAVFDKALTGGDITSIIAKGRLKGTEVGLLAGWSFEKPISASKPLPTKLARPWVQSPRAYHMPISGNRNSDDDKHVFENPFVIGEVSEAVQLPFLKNEVWYVIQGQDDPSSSHNGYATFCYDFMIANKPQTGDYPNGTAHAPVFSGAAGKIVKYRRSGAFDGPREPYFMKIRVGPDEHIGYLHLDGTSENAKATGGVCNQDKDCTIIQNPPSIAKGEKVGEQGPKAAHLHFSGAGQLDEQMTIPIAFTDYWASDDNGAHWEHVVRGHPKKGQLVKRTQ